MARRPGPASTSSTGPSTQGAGAWKLCLADAATSCHVKPSRLSVWTRRHIRELRDAGAGVYARHLTDDAVPDARGGTMKIVRRTASIQQSRNNGAGQPSLHNLQLIQEVMMRWSSAAAVYAVGMAVSVGSPAVLAESTPPTVPDDASATEANVGCEGARGLFLAQYWAFLRSNPQCIPDLDDDGAVLSLLAGTQIEGTVCPSGRSAYGSRGRCNTVRPR